MIGYNNQLMITIRCLTYNHEPYIRQCLDGFVMQKANFHFEAIVHDDASTDETAAIILEYAEKYPDIIQPIIETENQYSKDDGSLNKIMAENTRGKYIAICEGDDYWTDPYKLQKQVDFLESHPDYSMCCHRVSQYSQKRQIFVNDVRCYTETKQASIKDIIYKGGLFIGTCSMVFRRNVFEGYPSYCVKCHVGDYPLQIWCGIKGKVHYIDEPMGVYRIENVNSWVGQCHANAFSGKSILNVKSEVDMLAGFAKDYPSLSKFFLDRIAFYIVYTYFRIDSEKCRKKMDATFKKEIHSFSFFFFIDYLIVRYTRNGRLYRLYNYLFKCAKDLN